MPRKYKVGKSMHNFTQGYPADTPAASCSEKTRSAAGVSPCVISPGFSRSNKHVDTNT